MRRNLEPPASLQQHFPLVISPLYFTVFDVELALGAIGAADVCFRCGRSLIYKAIEIADTTFNDSRIIVEAIWLRTSNRLGVLESVWDLLDEDYQELQDRVIPALARKLESVTLQLSKVEKKYNPNGDILRNRGSRARYVVAVNSNLKQAIDELKAWEVIFDPTWYFTTTKLEDRVLNHERARGGSESRRAIQGLGDSWMGIMVNIVVSDMFSLRDRELYLAITSLAWAVGSATWPVLGGVFTTKLRFSVTNSFWDRDD
ncbi:uncharacterized protein BDV17DRAFT_288541 [Aspergillus undulatus]|uniref:uncharacterized protein n=1 Tax=Aspergillus undulatus TaxID=1810928 RepID=UPI003CCDCEDC